MSGLFVTGAAGFIGSRFAQMATDAGHIVYGADQKKEPDDDREFDPHMHWGCDIADFKQWQNALLAGGVASVIVHLAGTASTPGSMEKPYSVFTNNVVTAANVLQAARVLRVPVLMTSSVKARDGLTPYGASKRMVEEWSAAHRDSYDLPVVINRPGTVYGPGQEGSPESGWIAWFLKAKREGLPVTVNGPGSQVRDLLHVDDYCRLLLKQVEKMRKYSGKTWEVGGGPNNTVTVEEMAKHLGLKYDFGPPRYGDADTYVADNEVPDWEPEIGWRDSGMFA